MPVAEIFIESLPADAPIALEIGPIKIVLVRTAEGVFAFEDRCPHAYWPLSAGSFRDGVLECPGHGWEFDVRTGQCRDSPGYCLNRIHATVIGGTLRLEWPAVVSSQTTDAPACVEQCALPAADPSTPSA